MNNKIFLSKIILVFTAIIISIYFCRDDYGSDFNEIKIQKEIANKFEIISVSSDADGQDITMNLNFSIPNNKLRSFDYKENQDGGYEGIKLDGQEEKALLLLYREGDEKSLVYTEVVWRGRSTDSFKLENIHTKLSKDIKVNKSDKWLFSAIIGGYRYDKDNGRVYMGENLENDIPLNIDQSQKNKYTICYSLDLC